MGEESVKFLIDNRLQVYENSSVKMHQLVKEMKVEVATSDTEERDICQSDVAKWLRRSLATQPF